MAIQLRRVKARENKMNREAKELLRIAKSLIAMEFPSHKAMMDYLKEHPGADRSNHKVVTYHPNGQKESEYHFNGNGETDGTHSQWYEDGKKEYEFSSKNGAYHGKEQRWHPNGVLQEETNWEKGKRHGPHNTWHPNGSPYSKGNYDNGNIHGLWESYWDNGNLMTRGQWKNDKRVGIHDAYSKDGKSRHNQLYDKGFELTHKR